MLFLNSAVVGGYFFFHFLYYLLWFGRQMESLVYFNDRGAYRNFLSQPAWIIARPLFALINLGWHVTTPLGMKKYFCTTKGVQHIAIFCDYLYFIFS